MRLVVLEVSDGLVVDREEAAGGAVFGRHVADGRAVGDRHVGEAGAVEFHELADHALLAQHLGDGEHQVGGGHAFLQPAGELEADDLRDEHGDRLAEHGGLRLDAAHAPAEDGEAVDHGGVRIGADEGVRIGGLLAGRGVLAGPDGLGQEFQVDLVADAGARGNDGEVLEGGLAPLEEAVALAVALVFQLHVAVEGLRRAELVDDHRMVDDEIDGHERVDLARVAAEVLHGVAHGGEIHHRRNAGEVLHQDAGGAVGDFLLVLALVVEPGGHGLDIGLGDRAAVLVAQKVLEQHLHGEGQLRGAFQAVLLGLDEGVIGIGLVTDLKGLAGIEAVVERHGESSRAFGLRTVCSAESAISARRSGGARTGE